MREAPRTRRRGRASTRAAPYAFGATCRRPVPPTVTSQSPTTWGMANGPLPIRCRRRETRSCRRAPTTSCPWTVSSATTTSLVALLYIV